MIDLHRYPDWEARLAAYLDSVRVRPFEWGTHDCCLFAAGAVEAMTGVDPMPEFRGAYSTQRGARRALATHGASKLSLTLDTKFARVPASLAHRGDIVMHAGAIGIAGAGFLFMVGSEGEREGLIKVPRCEWIDPLAWRVAY
jgi:ferric-dicitrate binding protein FerR (iron transport regulator)